MKQILTFTLAIAMLFGVLDSTAQNASADKGNSFYLNFKGGIGVARCVDRSIIPYSFSGLTTGFNGGFTDEWKRCHIQFDFQWSKTFLSEPSGTMHCFVPKLEFLYSCLKPSESRWHFWSGVSVSSLVDFKSIPILQNAQATFSVFGNFAAEELVQCDFAYDKKDKSHPWMTAYFRFSLPLFTVASRPGYAYVHDPLGETHALRILMNSNETSFKMFPGYATDWGLTVNLRNGNRISFGHSINFLTTGKKGAYRYDSSFSTSYIQFMFKI